MKLFLSVLISSMFLVGCFQQKQLLDEVAQIKKDYEILQKQYVELQSQHDALKKQHFILEQRLKRYQESSRILFEQ